MLGKVDIPRSQKEKLQSVSFYKSISRSYWSTHLWYCPIALCSVRRVLCSTCLWNMSHKRCAPHRTVLCLSPEIWMLMNKLLWKDCEQTSPKQLWEKTQRGEKSFQRSWHCMVKSVSHRKQLLSKNRASRTL